MREDWVEVSEHQVRKGIARGWRKYGIWQRVHELKNIWLEYSLRKSVFHVILELTYRYIWNRPLDLTFVNLQRQKMRSLGTTISQVINFNSNRIMNFFSAMLLLFLRYYRYRLYYFFLSRCTSSASSQPAQANKPKCCHSWVPLAVSSWQFQLVLSEPSPRPQVSFRIWLVEKVRMRIKSQCKTCHWRVSVLSFPSQCWS